MVVKKRAEGHPPSLEHNTLLRDPFVGTPRLPELSASPSRSASLRNGGGYSEFTAAPTDLSHAAKTLGGAANSPSASRTRPGGPFRRQAVPDRSAQSPALQQRRRLGVGSDHCPLEPALLRGEPHDFTELPASAPRLQMRGRIPGLASPQTTPPRP